MAMFENKIVVAQSLGCHTAHYIGGYGVGDTERQALADLRTKLVSAVAEVDLMIEATRTTGERWRTHE